MDFFTLAPCRLIDTRNAVGTYDGPALVAGAYRAFPLFEQCGIPATARAVSVNLAVTQPTVAGNLRPYPAGTPPPTISSINYTPSVAAPWPSLPLRAQVNDYASFGCVRACWVCDGPPPA
jgi:hypothetical protein